MKGVRRKTTLKGKLLIVMIPLIMISLLTVSIILYYVAKRNIQSKVSEYMKQYLIQLCDSIDNKLETSIHMNAQLAVNPGLTEILKEYEKSGYNEKMEQRRYAEDIFVSLISIYDDIRGIYVFDHAGNEFYARKRYGDGGSRIVSDRDWYRKALEEGGAYVIFLDGESGADSRQPEAAIGIARSVVDIYTRESYGVVLVEIPYSILEESIYLGNRRLEQGDIFIRDEYGKVIYTTDPDNIYWDGVRDEMPEQDDFVSVRRVKGEEIIQITCISEKSGWRYDYICEMKDLMQDMGQMKKVVTILLLVVGIVTALITILFSNLFLQPLKELMSGMERVKEGDYSAQVKVDTKDEFRYLTLRFNEMTASISDLIQKVYHARLMQKEAQLEVLQQQINPHFLYNAFESMRGLALEEHCMKVADMVKNMAEFMRYNMVRSDSSALLEEEIFHVMHYVRIINYRFDHKILMSVEIPGEMKEILLPKFTLQPLVENAVLHGLAGKESDCRILIRGRMEDGIAVVEVCDNGCGIAEDMLRKINKALKDSNGSEKENSRKNIGIYNVNSRMKLNFGSGFGVELKSRVEEGTVVTVTFPVLRKKDAGTEEEWEEA